MFFIKDKRHNERGLEEILRAGLMQGVHRIATEALKEESDG
jgi:hypothetical protein